jgi:hypothetical protein
MHIPQVVALEINVYENKLSFVERHWRHIRLGDDVRSKYKREKNLQGVLFP